MILYSCSGDKSLLGIQNPTLRVRADEKAPTVGWSVVNMLNKPAIRNDCSETPTIFIDGFLFCYFSFVC